MTTPTIAFIGAGNMARSLIAGLVADLPLRVADPEPDQLNKIQQQWPSIFTSTDNLEVLKAAQVVVFAVKPQVMKPVAEALQALVQQTHPLIISVAAGIRVAALDQWLGGNLPIVRCMPNTPALVKCGATGLYANAQVSNEQRALAQRILEAVGIALWFDNEAHLDAVTAVSGSGPAYFFRIMEAMQAAGESLGLNPDASRQLVLQTALGAARLALESGVAPAELRQQVTSKGGTTEAALNVLNQGGLADLFHKALHAAAQRADELAKANH